LKTPIQDNPNQIVLSADKRSAKEF